MEQLIMNNADRVRCDVNDNSNNGNAGVNNPGKANSNGNTGNNKLLAFAALLLFALIAAPAQAIVVTYTHTDAQGSVVATSDANRVVTRFGHEPYGLPTVAPPPDGPGYTGHVHDGNSGLIYMQQRYYDPEVGQFLSTDPVGVSASTGANFNRYTYANNNPYRFVDPDGRLGCPAYLGNRCKGAKLGGREYDRTKEAERAAARESGTFNIEDDGPDRGRSIKGKVTAAENVVGVAEGVISALEKREAFNTVVARINSMSESELKEIYNGTLPPLGLGAQREMAVLQFYGQVQPHLARAIIADGISVGISANKAMLIRISPGLAPMAEMFFEAAGKTVEWHSAVTFDQNFNEAMSGYD